MGVHVGEGEGMPITTSYSTSASEIVVLFKTPKEILQNWQPTLQENVYTYHNCDPWSMTLYTIASEPIKTQELQNTIGSFLINRGIQLCAAGWGWVSF